MNMIFRWLIGVISAMITVYLVKTIGLTLSWPSTWGVIVFVPVLGIVNAVLGSILRLLSLPITCITLGLFGFVINAIVFYVAGTATGATMTFLSALVGSILYSVISTPLGWLVKEKDRRD